MTCEKFKTKGIDLPPCEDACGRIRTSSEKLDNGMLGFGVEYGEPLGDRSSVPTLPEWSVHFGGDFDSTEGKLCREICGGAYFDWCGESWRILGVYACDDGYVIDILNEVSAENIFSPEQALTVGFYAELNIDGTEMRGAADSCLYNIPVNEGNTAALRVLSHYGCDAATLCGLHRITVYASEPILTEPKSISITLVPHPKLFRVGELVTSCKGEKMDFVHPVSGAVHTLTVTKYEQTDMPTDACESALPPYCTTLCCTVDPPLACGDVVVRDMHRGDLPKPKNAASGDDFHGCIGIIGGEASVKETFGHDHYAVSAFTNKPRERIRWSVGVRVAEREKVTVSLLEMTGAE